MRAVIFITLGTLMILLLLFDLYTLPVNNEPSEIMITTQSTADASITNYPNYTSTANRPKIISSKRTKPTVPHVFINRQHKIIYCAIHKNCNMLFRNLFVALDRNEPNIFKIDTRVTDTERFHNSNGAGIHDLFDEIIQASGANFREYRRLTRDSQWTKFVIVRDPLERLLSGYLNRCLQYGACNGSPTHNFTFFVERLISDGVNNIHYKPQSTFCDLHRHFKKYSDVIIYDFNTIAEQTLQFLGKQHLIEYYYHWGPYYNETMFKAVTTHTTHNYKSGNEIDSKIQFYNKYYDKQLAEKLIRFYENDYALFGLEPPQWVMSLN